MRFWNLEDDEISEKKCQAVWFQDCLFSSILLQRDKCALFEENVSKYYKEHANCGLKKYIVT